MEAGLPQGFSLPGWVSSRPLLCRQSDKKQAHWKGKDAGHCSQDQELRLGYIQTYCVHIFRFCLCLKKTFLKRLSLLEGIPGQWKFLVNSGHPNVAILEHPEPSLGGADDNEVTSRTRPETSV